VRSGGFGGGRSADAVVASGGVQMPHVDSERGEIRDCLDGLLDDIDACARIVRELRDRARAIRQSSDACDKADVRFVCKRLDRAYEQFSVILEEFE